MEMFATNVKIVTGVRRVSRRNWNWDAASNFFVGIYVGIKFLRVIPKAGIELKTAVKD